MLLTRVARAFASAGGASRLYDREKPLFFIFAREVAEFETVHFI